MLSNVYRQKDVEVGIKSPTITQLFPGALGVKTFLRNCREQGIKMTLDEANVMREAWIGTFTEMQDHMNPLKAENVKVAFNAYGMNGGPDDEEDEEDNGRKEYKAILPCGQVRNHCSFNAACNSQFQGTTANGAKEAGWNLVHAGYGDRILNFVHDEFLYWLWPEEIRAHIPYIEQLMIAGMKLYIPDVKVGVESSCMLHWDKKATEFEKLQWTEDGLPILEEPPFVKELFNKQIA